MRMLSRAAEEELRSLAGSQAMKQDMETVAASRQNPFLKAGHVDVDAFLTFVCEYNAFINHQPKPFEAIRGADMRL